MSVRGVFTATFRSLQHKYGMGWSPISISVIKPPTIQKFHIMEVSTCIINYFPQKTRQLRQVDLDTDTKKKLVLLMNFKSNEDLLPFYKLPVKTLLHICKTTESDNSNRYCENRLYYIAERIKCPSAIVSERLVRRTFVYSLTFEWLKNSLDVLLNMGVSGDRILRDLWVLKYHHLTIQERLQRVKNMGIDTLYPWMVRCSEEILNRYIMISRDTKNILGDFKSTQVYLANRLHTTVDAVEDMCYTIPALKTIRVTKVKDFLDFLLEEGFQIEDIADKPRVLTASKKTVKQRLDKLRKLGLTHINLNVLCKSKKDYKKYCESIESIICKSDDNT